MVVHVRAHGEVMDTRTVAEVLLPAGATTVTLRLEEFTDEIDESPVNVTLTLAGGTGYSVGDPAEATVSIDYPSISDTQATPTPTPTPAVSPPDAPSGVSISAPSINSFTVSWTAEAGKTYRVEREAAYLFSYRVWQVVADNLSTGSFTENGLPCDLYYVYRVQAKIAGSPYGAGMAALATPQSCTGAKSARGSTTRGPTDPPFQLRLVTDNPTQTSIQIRLLFYGEDYDEQYNPVYGLDKFQVYRSVRVESGGSRVWPDPPIRKEGSNAEFHWEGLECSASYYFRARGEGDGTDFDDVYGPWSTDVHGSTRGCTAPVVSVIPMPQRKARLEWRGLPSDPNIKYVVHAVKGASGTINPTLSPVCGPSTSTECTINSLDEIKGGEGLAHSSSGFKFRVTIKDTRTGASLNDNHTEVVLRDTPIVSINGDSRGVPDGKGKMVVKLKDVADRQYALRYRQLPDGHSNIGWEPDSGTSYSDWTVVTDSLTTSGGELKYEVTLPAREKIYAVQANYTDSSGMKHLAAREAFVWPANRPSIIGERVATFPLSAPLRNALGQVNKTYEYFICEDTFNDTGNVEAWKKIIVHAFGQWQLATDDLVTMRYMGVDCANYEELVSDIASNNSLTVDDVREFVERLHYFGEFVNIDKEKNEVIMVDPNAFMFSASVRVAAEFPQLAQYLGFANCVFSNSRACNVSHLDPYRILYLYSPPFTFTRIELKTSDIFLNYQFLRHDSLTIPGGASLNPVPPDEGDVSFNKCVDPEPNAYSTLVHESGHALGIGDASDRNRMNPAFSDHHPTIKDSILNHDTRVGFPNARAEPDCSPHPFDIMAIFALYQTY